MHFHDVLFTVTAKSVLSKQVQKLCAVNFQIVAVSPQCTVHKIVLPHVSF